MSLMICTLMYGCARTLPSNGSISTGYCKDTLWKEADFSIFLRRICVGMSHWQFDTPLKIPTPLESSLYWL